MKTINNFDDLVKAVRNNKTRIGVTPELYNWLDENIPELEHKKEENLSGMPTSFYCGIEVYIEKEAKDE